MKNIYEFSTELRELFDYNVNQNEYKELIDSMIYYGSRGLCNKSKRVSAIIYPNGIYEIATNSPPEPFACANNEQCKKVCNQTCIHAEERAIIKSLQRHGEVDFCLCLHLKIVDGKPVTSGCPSCVTCSRKLLECKIKYMYLWQENGWKRWTAEEFHLETLNHLGLVTEKQCVNQQELFAEHLKNSSTIVQTWPIWKQQILGGLRK